MYFFLLKPFLTTNLFSPNFKKMESVFKDLKIVELANVLAGPAVGMFFSELGAEVIKVENKQSNGDVTRSWKLPEENSDSQYSAYFASVNYGKQFMMLDLNIPEERKKVYDLLKTADIVLCNYKPGDDLKLGMDYETLRKINPEIIYGSISGFGEHVKRTAYDLVLQAETGFMYMNGTKESGPVKMPVALIDILAAHQLKEGILVALIRRLKTNEGAKVSVSLYDAAIASLANQASNWLMTGRNPVAAGSLHPNIAPYGEMFKCADGKLIVLAVGNDKQFQHLCKILDRGKLAEDLQFSTNQERVKNRSKLFEELSPLFSRSESGKLMKQFIEKDVPAGIIRSLADVFAEQEAKSLTRSWKLHSETLQGVGTAIFKIE
jgi:crotonobetainyl-CoA:carnitine CoA-transferase CaiB-like acyl-CoA transferase